ncbi:hypothetical protein SS1G_08851 [Sclerotinia sclerotiorum 1980 UF-70]|uniref:Lccl domain-containing protein n=2 Tax=Sclerotinia sclerotiorum (strain ATCC 18683 / 1980 / Ss-1) TaxID=665079 RepID=A7EU44_SCLS1|nr:hypothetical protein SS1G_08851 [Sclerotinia sclerotiorum 1980 UF-70]APA15233.1 hypothetical protein sscle_14g100030 [Sclerotinia sclerotiorum 1980 UF-70]EDN92986.1 hypothetical protein SS1G_08851 [Sclerotinia sclerotiorum 1980 UF-70]
MSAPPEITLKDLSGDWVMNKTLSDDTDAVLALQGVGWWSRKAISLATVTLHVKEYIDENNIPHIDIDQTATGGIKGTSEYRTLDWVPRAHEDHLFGNVSAKSRFCNLEQVDDDAFLKEDWLEGEEENSGPDGERHVQTYGVNEERGWNAMQIWGFAIIDGKRYYTRRVVVKKGSEVLKVRLVYNWQGKQ